MGLLVDGDPATAWTTERYSSAAFGNLKDGVGVLLDLGRPVPIAEVRLLGLGPGQSLQLRVAEDGATDQPPDGGGFRGAIGEAQVMPAS